MFASVILHDGVAQSNNFISFNCLQVRSSDLVVYFAQLNHICANFVVKIKKSIERF